MHQGLISAAEAPARRIAPAPAAMLDRTIPAALLVRIVVGWLAADMIVLLRFLDAPIPLVLASMPLALLVFGWSGLMIRSATEAGPSVRCMLTCFGFALALCILGGEGHLFYANVDWRVRDAILRDMVMHDWPFAYTARGLPEILRAPVGMYLFPALAGKAAGLSVAFDAILVQNSVLLATLLALSSMAFCSARARIVAFATFVFFSGADILGAEFARAGTGDSLPQHLELWSGLQYSSDITLLFWVPHHALAGWAFAVAFLLWKTDRARAALPLAILPLSLLWSPLAAMGALPFAAFIGIESLFRRRIGLAEILLPAAAVLLAIPTLAYLNTAAGDVGSHIRGYPAINYLLFELLEVFPFLVLCFSASRGTLMGKPLLVLIAACLLCMPFYQVGFSLDFMMRASIVPLALLAAICGDLLMSEPSAARRGTLALVLAVGSVTGGFEVARALAWPRPPASLCSFYGAWGPSDPAAKSTYLAPVAKLPTFIRHAPAAFVAANDPARCWNGPWPLPTGL